MATVLDSIIYPATRLLRILGAPGRGNSQEERAEALDVLNMLIDDLRTQSLLSYSTSRILQNLVTGQQTYQAGNGSPDWNIPRPVRVEKASLIYQSDMNQPLELPLKIIDDEEWQRIPVKNITSPVPWVLYPDGGFPYNGINLWPIPAISNQIALYLWVQLSQYVTVDDVVSLPPAYLKMLQYNLAVELAPRYERAVLSPLVIDGARRAIEHIKSLNTAPYELDIDPFLVGRDFGGYGGFFGVVGSTGGGGGGTGGNVINITVTGTISGTNGSDGNSQFTLSTTPRDDSHFMLFKNGILMTQSTSYTRSGNVVTFLAPQIPVVGDTLAAAGTPQS
jgi:hypothetical protein